MFLSNLSLKRPVLATVTIIALVVLGFYSYFQLDINDWPEIEFPIVAVTIVQPGVSPEQMENKVALKVEEAMGQIAGIKHIYTQVQESAVLVLAEFTLATEVQTATQDVRDKLSSIRHELPPDIEEPVISRYDPTAAPIMSLAVTGGPSILETSKLVDDVIKGRLEIIPGVGTVEVVGGEQREIQINLDADRLTAYMVSPAEVAGALHLENLEIPAGDLKGDDGRKVAVRTAGEVSNWEDFALLPVTTRAGVLLRVGDLAEVTDSIKNPVSRTFFQGEPVVGLNIIKQTGNNTVRIADELNTAIKKLNQQLPDGVQIQVVRDNSVRVRASVNNVLVTLFEGTLLAILTVFLFLRNWRSTLIGAAAIPTSIITTFLMLKYMDFSLNTMSLIALSLSIGLLIDDAVVVIENIVRHLQMGKPPLQAAKEATAEIGLAVMATTFTVVAVFLPVALMSEMAGKFLKQFGLTVVFSLLVSLLVAFTLVPLLSSRHLRAQDSQYRGPVGCILNTFERGFEWFKAKYVRLLGAALRHRWKTLGIAGVLFALSLAIIPFLGSSFVPNSDFGELSVVLDLDAGLTLDAAAQAATQADEIIKQHPQVVSTFVSAVPNEARIFVQLTDKKQRHSSIEDVAAELREKLQTLPGSRASMLFYNLFAEQYAWENSLLGDDLDLLAEYAEKIQVILENTPGAVDITSSWRPGTPETRLAINAERAADLGISPGYVGDTLYTLLTGKVATQYKEGEDRVDVRLQLKEAQRKNLDDLSRISLPTPTGNVALSQVTQPEFSTAPSIIKRYDRSREISLSGNLRNVSLGTFNQQFEQRLEQELALPPGYRIYAGATAEDMQETFDALGVTMVLGILFIFFILAAQFESYIEPFAIMFALPLAIVGAIVALFLMGSDISLVSMIGIIMLMGLVTKNAILLIDFAKQARARGTLRDEAVKSAAAIRLRPIMMTSTAMILGMMPVAMSLGAGTEWRAPMAHAVIGGLITSTLLTLVIVPVIYTLLDDLTERRKNGKSKNKNRPSKQEAAST